ncbi:MAG: DUF4058 family protein [Planctomycetaceae bacterium]|nr:DUF4058 family protein [Planctomycetaceae bacterium]
MPSPFPGIDPFLESQEWEDFHTSFLVTYREVLLTRLPLQYSAGVEKSVYLVCDEDDSVVGIRVPDAPIATGDPPTFAPTLSEAVAGGAAVIAKPTTLTLPTPRKVRQTRLRILKKDSQQVVTVIELLFPWNKTGEGRAEYLAKREDVLASDAHLVELDFLRGGRRLPTRESLPPADYYAFVCSREQRPKVDVFSWSLREPLPSVPVPLANSDPDCRMPLQEVFTTTYERSGYQRSLRYGEGLSPPLNEADLRWVSETLANSGG